MNTYNIIAYLDKRINEVEAARANDCANEHDLIIEERTLLAMKEWVLNMRRKELDIKLERWGENE